MKRHPHTGILVLSVVCTAVLIQGCSDDNNNTPAAGSDVVTSAAYSISAVNLMAGQPLSPPLLALHDDTFSMFRIGSPASVGLEVLAEAGDNATLLGEAVASPGVYVTFAGESALAPGGVASWTLVDIGLHADRRLSMASMLVNTNDAFSALNGHDIASLAVGESLSLTASAYDAGTEANSEAAGTIPGPADGGQGHSQDRDDIADQVAHHSGVVTGVDGLAGSVLTDVHRFLNPVMRITITRTE